MMANGPRPVIPGLPHHVTQRGNGQQPTFFETADYALYVGDFATLLAQDIDEATAFLPLRKAESIGRPKGHAHWIAALEARVGRTLTPAKRGLKFGSLGVK